MRIFLSGGTGFLGSNIIKVALERYRAKVFTTVNRWHSNEPQPFDYAAVDITNCVALTSAVRDFEPDVIIHSAILNDFARIYADRALAWRNYVESTRCLCEVANSIDAKLIFVSTDWVFDGTQGPADELTPPNPINYYGVLKVVGETLVMSMARNGAVARVAGVNGTHWLRPNADQGQNAGFGYFSASVIKSLQSGEPLVVWEGAINMRATPGLASENAKLILEIAKQDRQGIYHCCAGDAVSRLELAHIIADVFQSDPGLIKIGPPPPDDPASLIGYPVPRDTSLDAHQSASILGYTLPSVRKLMENYRHEVTTGTLA